MPNIKISFRLFFLFTMKFLVFSLNGFSSASWGFTQSSTHNQAAHEHLSKGALKCLLIKHKLICFIASTRVGPKPVVYLKILRLLRVWAALGTLKSFSFWFNRWRSVLIYFLRLLRGNYSSVLFIKHKFLLLSPPESYTYEPVSQCGARCWWFNKKICAECL